MGRDLTSEVKWFLCTHRVAAMESSTEKPKIITAKGFSYPHTKFGGGWELGLPQIRKCHFLSDPYVFGYIF